VATKDLHAARAFRRLVGDVTRCHACTGMMHSHALSTSNGPVSAPVIFIAEAVGRRGGAVTGVPLTRDESGQRFARFLALAEIPRDSAFVTNAVLCNPLDARGRNRAPYTAETAACRAFLARTLEVVRASVVVTLGAIALASLDAIEPHGLVLARDVARPSPWHGRTLVPLYHPSRQSTLHRAQAMQDEDWRRLRGWLRRRTDSTEELPEA
jgi:DNA polymerase